jgi:hypothetical protein
MVSRLSDTSPGSSDDYETDDYHPSDHDSDDAFMKSGRMKCAPPRTTSRGRERNDKAAGRIGSGSKNGSGGKSRAKPPAKKSLDDSYEGDHSSSDEEFVAKQQAPQKQKYAIGTAISKDFDGDMYSGTITKYHPKEKQYSIRYEDGDEEDLSEHELDELSKKTGRGGGAKITGGLAKKLAQKTTKKSGGDTDSFSDNSPKKPAARDFQSDGDSDDDPFAHLDKKRGKRKQIKDYSDSDDDSLSDESSGKKKPPGKAQRRMKEFSSDENSDEDFLFGRKTAEKKNISVHDCSSDSDVELLSPRKPAARRSPLKSTGSRSNSNVDDYTDQDFKIHPSPKKKSPKKSQSTHSSAVRAETERVLAEAKAYKEALRKANEKKASESEEEPVDLLEVDDDSSVEVAVAPAAVPATAAQNVYSGALISLKLRYNNKTVILGIKMDEPLKFLNERLQSQSAGLSISSLQFDGQRLNMNKTPQFYEMEAEDLLDAVVQGSSASDIIALHVRNNGASHKFGMRKTFPISKLVEQCCSVFRVTSVNLKYNGRSLDPSKTCQAEGIPNEASLDAVTVAMIQLEFRVNGKDPILIHVPQSGSFGTVMETFARKKSVAVKDCKFIFDGEVLQPSTTLESLDLEGGEIIDVALTESAAEAPPLHDDGGDAAMGEVEGVVISVKTVRNVSPYLAIYFHN